VYHRQDTIFASVGAFRPVLPFNSWILGSRCGKSKIVESFSEHVRWKQRPKAPECLGEFFIIGEAKNGHKLQTKEHEASLSFQKPSTQNLTTMLLIDLLSQNLSRYTHRPKKIREKNLEVKKVCQETCVRKPMMKTKNPTFVADVDLLTKVETMKARPICIQQTRSQN
jgi:hypothetical protein